MLLLLPCFLLLASLHGAAEAMSCSSGDTEYMCTNLDTCWVDLGFGSKGDLQYLCEIQGIFFIESSYLIGEMENFIILFPLFLQVIATPSPVAMTIVTPGLR